MLHTAYEAGGCYKRRIESIEDVEGRVLALFGPNTQYMMASRDEDMKTSNYLRTR